MSWNPESNYGAQRYDLEVYIAICPADCGHIGAEDRAFKHSSCMRADPKCQEFVSIGVETLMELGVGVWVCVELRG